MREISKSVVKKDHQEKIGGSALYVGDYPQDDIASSSINLPGTTTPALPFVRLAGVVPFCAFGAAAFRLAG